MEKGRRRIWFLRSDERKAEEARMRIVTHKAKCEDFADELFNVLLIQSPTDADKIIQAFKDYLYGKEEK